MAKFPIRYAEKGPPGFGPSVRANLDVRTGEPEIWEQMARAGGRLAAVASKLRQAEDVVGNAEVKLKMDRETNAYISAYQTTGDPEALTKLTEQYETKIRSFATNKELQVHGIGRISQTATWVAKHEIERRIRDNQINMERTLQSYRETGDADAHKALVAAQVSNKMLLPEEGVDLIQNFPVDSPLAQMDNLLASDNPADWQIAENKLQEMPIEIMTEDQLADRKRWLSAVVQKRKASFNAAMIGIIDTMDEKKELPQEKKIPIGEELKTQLRRATRDPERYWAFMERINDWVEGKDAESNPTVWSDLFRDARGLHINSTQEEIGRVEQRMIDATSAGQLSWTDAKYLRQMLADRLEESEAYNVNFAVEQGERNGKDPVVLHRALISEIRAKGISPDKIVRTGARIAATLPDMPPKDAFTVKWIATHVGEMEAIGRDYVRAGEGQASVGVEEFVSKAFGQNWYQFPAVRKEYVRLFPVRSWNFQTDEEKQATVDWLRSLEWRFFGPQIAGVKGLDTVKESTRDEIVDDIATSPQITPEQDKKIGEYLKSVYGAENVPEPVNLPPSGEQPFALPTMADLPVVITDEDFEALPSGTDFQDENGERFRKP